MAAAAHASLVSSNIYRTLTPLPCTRLLNADGEIGCTSARSAVVLLLFTMGTVR